MRAELGVSGPQRSVLRLLRHHGELSPGDLAELLHIDPSSLTGILQRLEGAKMLRRVRDTSDGRRAILTLTRKGRGVLARRTRTVEDSVRRVISAIPRGKLRAAREVLIALADELDREGGKESRDHRKLRPLGS